MSFSVKINSEYLNDYISPSQACVRPLIQSKTKGKAAHKTDKEGVALSFDDAEEQLRAVSASSETHFSQMKVDEKRQTAVLTLADCLACSGCVTSAETMLMEQQSISEFLSNIAKSEQVVVVSVSPHSRTSLAAHFGLDILTTAKKLTSFFKSLGVRLIFDTGFAQDFALLEVQQEFIQRYRVLQSGGHPHFPLITSECPGWVCYAEKKQGETIFPHMSTVKSPQQILGALVKSRTSSMLHVAPQMIFHTSIMPCYDKKLEAVRPASVLSSDLIPSSSSISTAPSFCSSSVAANGFSDSTSSPASLPLTDSPSVASMHEVDCVLTTGEVLQLIRDKLGENYLAIFSQDIALASLDLPFSNVEADQSALIGPVGSGGNTTGSGGYLEAVFRHAASILFGLPVDPSQPLPYKTTFRNSPDLKEVILELPASYLGSSSPPASNSSEPTFHALHFAAAYGFKNIQNLLRKIKRGDCPYHFVELMACPSGCLNGGGQIKPVIAADKNPQGARLLLQQLEQLHSAQHQRSTALNENVNALYRDWIQDTLGSQRAHDILHTSFHAVSMSQLSPLIIQW